MEGWGVLALATSRLQCNVPPSLEGCLDEDTLYGTDRVLTMRFVRCHRDERCPAEGTHGYGIGAGLPGAFALLSASPNTVQLVHLVFETSISGLGGFRRLADGVHDSLVSLVTWSVGAVRHGK